MVALTFKYSRRYGRKSGHMVDLVTIAVVVAASATSVGSVIAAWYYLRRISIEKQRSTDMRKYYEEMLSLEREKVAVERAKLEQRRNGP